MHTRENPPAPHAEGPGPAAAGANKAREYSPRPGPCQSAKEVIFPTPPDPPGGGNPPHEAPHPTTGGPAGRLLPRVVRETDSQAPNPTAGNAAPSPPARGTREGERVRRREGQTEGSPPPFGVPRSRGPSDACRTTHHANLCQNDLHGPGISGTVLLAVSVHKVFYQATSRNG